MYFFLIKYYTDVFLIFVFNQLIKIKIMKNISLQSAKRLSKKELKTIAGGKLYCLRPNPCMEPCEQAPSPTCTLISVSCVEIECRPQ